MAILAGETHDAMKLVMITSPLSSQDQISLSIIQLELFGFFIKTVHWQPSLWNHRFFPRLPSHITKLKYIETRYLIILLSPNSIQSQISTPHHPNESKRNDDNREIRTRALLRTST
jgi:hypothetical protein